MYTMNIKDGQYIGPAIKIIDDALENPNEIIAISQQFEDWSDAKIGEGNIVKDFRSTKMLMMPHSLNHPAEWFNISQLLYAQAVVYADENQTGFGAMETAQLLHYEAGEGFYKQHVDDSPFNPRNISAILYLNDVEEGGETFFHNFNLSIKPVAGRLILFPSNYAYIHEAKAPLSNDKFVIVQWFNHSNNAGHNHEMHDDKDKKTDE